jgi:dihydroorotate dehydrogenase
MSRRPSLLAPRPLHVNSGSLASTLRRFCYRPSVPRYRHKALPLSISRNASTAESTTESATRPGNIFRKAILRTSLVVAVLGGYIYLTDTRASVHRCVIVPLIRWLYPDAEDAHHAGVGILKRLYKYHLHPRERNGPDSDGSLSTEVLPQISYYFTS